MLMIAADCLILDFFQSYKFLFDRVFADCIFGKAV